MNQTPKSQKESKGYAPKNVIMDYMRHRVRFEKKYKKMKLARENITDDRTYQNLKQRKRRMLNTVFQSMANLLFFFESIANIPSSKDMKEEEREAHKRLQEELQDDVEELLGVRKIKVKIKVKQKEYPYKEKEEEVDRFVIDGSMFDRLISSVIYTGDKRGVDPADQFRLKLIYILQQNVFLYIQGPLFPDFTPDGKHIVQSDIGRATTWTEILAKRTVEDHKATPPSRTFNFGRYLFLERVLKSSH